MASTAVTPATTSTISVSRPSVTGFGGAVAGKMASAVQAGVDILADGGNAIDAAVATAFAMGVVEPWMNGLGGGGFIVGWLADERRSFAIEFPMMSPSGATEDMFPLADGVDTALFGWPQTRDNANVLGYRSIAIPGTVAGLALALERYGTMSLARVLEPAIALAEAGLRVSWHTTLMVAKDLANLRRFPATAEIYLDRLGCPPVTFEQASPANIATPDIARTLRTLADEGARAFYEGSLAHTLVSHLVENGTPVTAKDFASYQATEAETTDVMFNGHAVRTVGKGTGGTSLAEALEILERLDLPSTGHNSPESLHKFAYAFRQAFADRFTYLADPDLCEVPLDTLTSAAYVAEVASRFDPNHVSPIRAGTKEALGVSHSLAPSVAEYMRDGSTTHLGVIDGAGNAVALTQTLLSAWGSRVTVPGTGVLLNNGMMWFDPEPGRPNSVGPGKRPLTNMAPALVTREDRLVASIGSSGGRRIMNCNAQLIADIAAFGLGAGDAMHAPRIDASTRNLDISARMDAATRNALIGLGHRVQVLDESQLTGGFASPTVLVRGDDDAIEAAADQWYFPATAIALP